MLTRRTLLESSTERLQAAGIDDARRNVEWMLEEALGVNRAAVLAYPDLPVSNTELKSFEGMLARRLRREPLQYVVGHADFYGLRLRVTSSVLIPRPETEELVEEALRRLAGLEAPWVLDVGTGSGAIALAIKHERPDAEVIACDVSEMALEVAAANADRLGLEITLVLADALAPAFVEGVPACFDLLISNPPYVPEAERAVLEPEVRDFEPDTALFTGDDPLVFYRALTGHAERILKPGGQVLFEAHADYASEVRNLLDAAGFTRTDLRRDLAGRDRIVWGRMRER